MDLNNGFELGNSVKNILGNYIPNNNYDFEYNKNDFNINNPMDSHAAIARNVKENSEVLDVGCASGKLGNILKDFKNCIIDGIEYDEVSANLASKSGAFRSVYCCSISDEDNLEYKKFVKNNKKYDYIIFGDVLEHLLNPYDVLKRMSKKLKKDGKIVISLPNVAYIDTIIGLINGKFNYNHQGILDCTHLRFFTENSFRDMIYNLGENEQIYFDIKLTDKIIVKPSYIDIDKVKELFNEESIAEYLTLQNIFVLSLTDKKKKVKYNTSLDNQFNDLIIKMSYLKDCEKKLSTKEKEHIKLEEEKEQLEKKLLTKEKEYIKLEEEKELLNKKLEKILTSKRWVFINKFFNIIKR